MNYLIRVKEKTFSSFEEFGKNIYLYPDEAYALLSSPKFLKILLQTDKVMFQKIQEAKENNYSVEAFLFDAQYIFCPKMEIKHHRYSFKTVKDLGEKIISYGPDIDIYLKDFLKFKLLSKYLLLQGYDKLEPRLYNGVLQLEKEFLVNGNRAYFKLGFLLSKRKTIIYRRREYSNYNEFFEAMLSPRYLVEFSNNFEKNQYIFAWMEVLGQQKMIGRFLSLIDTIEKQEVEVK